MKKVIFCFCAFLLLTGCSYYRSLQFQQIPDNLNGPYPVIRVVDGDTIVVAINETDTHIRMIGMDTPESVHPQHEKNTPEGEEASAYTRKLLSGQSVYLEYDVQILDKYGRTLAYVYLQDEITMINRQLLLDGMAVLDTVPPNTKYADDFYQTQQKAREEKAGFWADFFLEETENVK